AGRLTCGLDEVKLAVRIEELPLPLGVRHGPVRRLHQSPCFGLVCDGVDWRVRVAGKLPDPRAVRPDGLHAQRLPGFLHLLPDETSLFRRALEHDNGYRPVLQLEPEPVHSFGKWSPHHVTFTS